MIPNVCHYWLRRAHVPACLLGEDLGSPDTREGLCLIDMEIRDGYIIKIQRTRAEAEETECSQIDLHQQLLFPGFIDIHTHLDKGHIWERSPNENGTFEGALKATAADVKRYYGPEDLYQRFEFGLRCSYAHGTVALRTHIDSFARQGQIGFEVFQVLRQAWQSRITLQAVCLVSVDYYQTAPGIALADHMAAVGGILGGVAYQNPQLKAQLTQIFQLAQERHLGLDLHVDETNDPQSQVLRQVAQLALELDFKQPLLCGHCCSLGVQSPARVAETLQLVKQAGIGIVSLPLCNLYLQDRHRYQTPSWRGITRVKEIRAHQIPLALASDNCRDPFFAFGDHDVLEVLTQSVRIAHLDHPYGDWCRAVTRTAAQLMGLPHRGQISRGSEADFIIFKARFFSELFSRPQTDRQIVRGGRLENVVLPEYRELDNLVFSPENWA